MLGWMLQTFIILFLMEGLSVPSSAAALSTLCRVPHEMHIHIAQQLVLFSPASRYLATTKKRKKKKNEVEGCALCT